MPKKLSRQLADKKHKVMLILLVLIALLAFNQFYSLEITRKDKISKPKILDSKVNLKGLSEADLATAQSYIKLKKIKASFIPIGIPDIYGRELDVSFDKVQDAINKVAPLDPTYGNQKVVLRGEDLKRYINIGSQIACQYCCGVKTLVFENGEAACGCEHSQMMRGLAAYLIKNHPELSDEQILQELNTWKISYFPKQTLSAKLTQMEKAGEPGTKEILEEFPDFLPQMVGSC